MAIEITGKWRIREYKEDDEVNITRLLNIVFGTSRSINYWKWKYRNNPMGFKAFVAEDKSRIVAHYGLIYSNIRIGHRTIIGSQAVDAVTRSDYQGKGIFVDLGKEILHAAGADGVPLTYGFPNEAAMPGHRKVGWIEVCTVRVLLRPLSLGSLLGRYINIGAAKVFSRFADNVLEMFIGYRGARVEDLSVSLVSSFDRRAEEFWLKIAGHHGIMQERNREFLNWRYTRNPTKRYSIMVAERSGDFLGYAVLGEIGQQNIRGGAIVDLQTISDRGQISEHLISEAIKYFRERNMGYIACLMRKGSIYYQSLRKHGFMPSTKKVRFIVHTNSQSRSNFSNIPFDKWFFTWGDSDFM